MLGEGVIQFGFEKGVGFIFFEDVFDVSSEKLRSIDISANGRFACLGVVRDY